MIIPVAADKLWNPSDKISADPTSQTKFVSTLTRPIRVDPNGLISMEIRYKGDDLGVKKGKSPFKLVYKVSAGLGSSVLGISKGDKLPDNTKYFYYNVGVSFNGIKCNIVVNSKNSESGPIPNLEALTAAAKSVNFDLNSVSAKFTSGIAALKDKHIKNELTPDFISNYSLPLKNEGEVFKIGNVMIIFGDGDTEFHYDYLKQDFFNINIGPYVLERVINNTLSCMVGLQPSSVVYIELAVQSYRGLNWIDGSSSTDNMELISSHDYIFNSSVAGTSKLPIGDINKGLSFKACFKNTKNVTRRVLVYTILKNTQDARSNELVLQLEDRLRDSIDFTGCSTINFCPCFKRDKFMIADAYVLVEGLRNTASRKTEIT